MGFGFGVGTGVGGVGVGGRTAVGGVVGAGGVAAEVALALAVALVVVVALAVGAEVALVAALALGAALSEEDAVAVAIAAALADAGALPLVATTMPPIAIAPTSKSAAAPPTIHPRALDRFGGGGCMPGCDPAHAFAVAAGIGGAGTIDGIAESRAFGSDCDGTSRSARAARCADAAAAGLPNGASAAANCATFW